MPRQARIAVLVLVPLILALLHLAWVGGQLPERVPSHFDAAGRPNDWMTRSGLLWTFGGLQVSLAALFLGLACLMRRMPLALINVPYKSYWFDGARREASLDWVSGFLAATGAACSLLLLGILQLTLAASRRDDDGLDNGAFWLLLGAYGMFTLGSLVALFLRFRRPPA